MKSEKLAQAMYRVQACELKVSLIEDTAKKREDAILGNYELRITAIQQAYDAQFTAIQNSCAQQVDSAIEQSKVLFDKTFQSCQDRVASLSEAMLDAAKPPWYAHPLFIGSMVVLGAAAGVGVGAIIWR